MSYLSDALVACPNVQDDLDAYFSTGGAANGVIYESMPFLQFVSTNSGLSRAINRGESRLATVELLYKQFISEDDVNENVANPSCVATASRGNLSQIYQMDPTDNVNANEKIPRDKFRYQCQNNQAYFAEVLMSLVNVVDRRIATKTATQSVALTGAWGAETANVDGGTLVGDEFVVQTKKAGSVDLYPWTMEAIEAALMTSLYDNDTFIVGGLPLWQYYRRIQNGCCANQGVDLRAIQEQFGYAVAYDKRIAKAFSPDESLAIRAGALQLVTYNAATAYENMEAMFRDAGDYVEFVLFSPQTGIPYDVVIKEDCGVMHINVTGTTKLFGAPEDMFPTGSDYDGEVFVNKIKVTNS